MKLNMMFNHELLGFPRALLCISVLPRALLLCKIFQVEGTHKRVINPSKSYVSVDKLNFLLDAYVDHICVVMENLFIICDTVCHVTTIHRQTPTNTEIKSKRDLAELSAASNVKPGDADQQIRLQIVTLSPTET